MRRHDFPYWPIPTDTHPNVLVALINGGLVGIVLGGGIAILVTLFT